MTSPAVRANLFPVGSTAPATAKALTAQQYDFTVQRLAAGTTGAGTATAAELQLARDSLQIGTGSGRNKFKNGGCLVAQRLVLAAVSLSIGPQIGAVDDVAVWASAGAVSAGTIAQTSASVAGITGYACRAAGVTLTGSAVLSMRKRVESRDAVKLKNRTGVVSVQVAHDVGAAVNYNVVVRKANAVNDFSATTVVYTGAVQSVPSGVASQVVIPPQALGDVSNGIEVELRAACGAVTSKNFDATEWQIEEAGLPTLFEQRNYGDELRDCQRYLPFYSFATGEPIGAIGAFYTTTDVRFDMRFPVEMLRKPTSMINSAANSIVVVANSTTYTSSNILLNQATVRSAEVVLTVPVGTSGLAGILRAAGAATIYFPGGELAA